MSVTRVQMKHLLPYLEGQVPNRTHDDGTREWDMHCPLHEDSRRSASLNVDKGYYYCNACEEGGTVTSLLSRIGEWVSPPSGNGNGSGIKSSSNGHRASSPAVLNQGMVDGWHSALMANETALEDLIIKRGLYTDTIIAYGIGYDRARRIYTIPVYDTDGDLINCRFYDMYPRDGRRKIWHMRGHENKVLYPISILEQDPDEIFICEGEWDALVNIQNGYPTITRTAAADVWLPGWNRLFRGKTVYVCHDMDAKGYKANGKVAAEVKTEAREVRIIALPYPRTEKNGADLSDFWQEHDRQDMEELLRRKDDLPKGEKSDVVGKEIQLPEITILESFEAQHVAKPVRMLVTARGRNETSYVIPHMVRYECGQDAGTMCQLCPLMGHGEAESELRPDDPRVLEIIGESQANARKTLLNVAEIPGGCKRVQIAVETHQPAEIIYARTPIDFNPSRRDPGDAGTVRITHVGERTPTNATLAFSGARYPHPRSHAAEFLAWEAERHSTSIDSFELSDEAIRLMCRFQTQRQPLKKLAAIARELSRQVTHIYGRDEMHVLMDLVYHSALSFKLAGEMVPRGWLEGLIVGDTRTGKSLAGERLMRHYGAGEIISCEAASFAGVVGGLQQLGNKEWAVTWGVIPLNDQRLVMLDEISGLSPEEISMMSDVRSSGVAKLTKIQQSQALARTRLLWMGNPRNSNMARYTYGVDAIKPLIGNNEDIARFDIAMTVADNEVPIQEINKLPEYGERRYTSEACHTLLIWAWTRQTDQVIWAPGAEQAVIDEAFRVGAMYTPYPPLVQAANIRVKIARLAVAVAARLFSTDKTWENIYVQKEHVHAGVQFLNHLYGLRGFGYLERSRQRIRDVESAREHGDAIREYLSLRPQLADFLLRHGNFKRQDLDEVLNVSREEANAIINTLYQARMISKDGGFVVIEPTLHDLLREGV